MNITEMILALLTAKNRAGEINFSRKTPVRFTGNNKVKKPGRNRPARGYDQTTRTWRKP